MVNEFTICPQCNHKTAFIMSRYDVERIQEEIVKACICGYRSDVTIIRKVNGTTVKENRKWNL